MKRPLYLHRKKTRHGNIAWYFWRGEGHKRIRIKGEYGSPEFMNAYQEAFAGNAPAIEKAKEEPETLNWLVARYRETSAWSELAEATRRQRENIFKRVLKKAGTVPFKSITRSHIVATRDEKRHTPSAANNFINTMRKLFEWAIDAGFVETDPTAKVKSVKRPKTGGFHQWTREEIERYEARWPIGTRERLALAILLYTGFRRGDAARLGRQHIKNGIIELRTEKTDTPVIIPVLSSLQKIIDASPKGDLALIACKKNGHPMQKTSFGNWFKESCQAAGVPGAAHGLRKAGAAKAAEEGATVNQLNAIYGWTGTRMASLYTEKADRAKMAREFLEKMENK